MGAVRPVLTIAWGSGCSPWTGMVCVIGCSAGVSKRPGCFRFHQQDLGSDGTLVLVWTISDPGDGTLVIEPTADR